MNKDRLNLLLLGLAAGDSLGSTSEFEGRESVPKVYEKAKAQGWPFHQVGAGAFGWKAGEATDDTDMALCIVRSFIHNGHFDGEDVAEEFVGWLNTSPPDVGNATRKGLSAVRSGTPWYEGGLGDYRQNKNSAANGSLMRNGVVAAMAASLDDAFRISLHQSLPTHYGPLPILCCCAQSYLLWELLVGRNPLVEGWVTSFEQTFLKWLKQTDDAVVVGWREKIGGDLHEAIGRFRESEFDPDSFDPFALDFAGSDGYCLLTLQIAVWAAYWSRRKQPFPTPKRFPNEVFHKAVGPLFLSAVAMIGRDSDTYGAIAGPLIAAVHGSVPQELTEGLEVLAEMKLLGIAGV